MPYLRLADADEIALYEYKSFLRTRRPPRTTFANASMYQTIHQGHFSNLKSEIIFDTPESCKFGMVEGIRLWQSRLTGRDEPGRCHNQKELELRIEGVWRTAESLV